MIKHRTKTIIKTLIIIVGILQIISPITKASAKAIKDTDIYGVVGQKFSGNLEIEEMLSIQLKSSYESFKIRFTISFDSDNQSDFLEVGTTDRNNKEIDKKVYSGEKITIEADVDYGDCFIILYAFSENCSGDDLSYTVETEYLEKGIKASPKFKKNKITVLIGKTKDIEFCYLEDNPKVKWKLSNKNITLKKCYTTYNDRSIVKIHGLKKGTTTVTATYKGKKYKCIITVKGYDKLKIESSLVDYNTRNNTFSVYFRNISNNTITVLKNNAIAVDSDYKSYDRNVKLTNNIKIKPGYSKILKFKVIGSLTWYNYKDFAINYNIKYKGKILRLASMDGEVYLRTSSKWKCIWRE